MSNSSIWPYIASLKPQLRAHVEVLSQIYRSERWYVLHDQSSKQYLRFNEHAYAILGRFDGVLTLEEILEHANEGKEEDLLTEEEVIGLLGQLNAAEVLKDGLPINAQDAFLQYKSQQKTKKQRAYMNPLSIKLSLLDPDSFLNKLLPVGKLLFSQWGLWIWGMTVLFAFLLALTHTSELGQAMSTLEFSSRELFIVWLIYPFIKALHELGHGLALKTWGGEVHEMGINLLVFMPVPYVDATDSWSFSNKWRRMAVGAAGIFVELFLASLALFLWLNVEEGVVKYVLLNVMLIAGFSTLLFNGNPLLRYDGYFVFEDWLEIPNLASRAKKYYYYLIQKYILKIDTIHSPVTASGEKKWFLLYGFLAPLYRLVILFGIALYLVDNFLVLGIALASWTVIMQLIVPVVKGLQFLLTSERLDANRSRAFGLMVLIGIGVILFLFVPVPVTTYTEGVIWTEGDAQVTAGATGFIKKVYVPTNTAVDINQTLMVLEDESLMTAYKTAKYRVNELQAEYISQEYKNLTKAAMIKDDLHAAHESYRALSEKVKNLTIKSKSQGVFTASNFDELTGYYVHQGDTLGYIINADKMIVKAVVPQARIGLIETYDTKVEFSLANDLKKRYVSKIIRKTPQATTYLASAVLGTSGGGMFPVDTRDKSGKKLLTPVFQIDLEIPKGVHLNKIGGRVYVRLSHGELPLAKQFALSFNQLFLRHFYAK